MGHPDTIPSSSATPSDPKSYTLTTIQDIFDLHSELEPESGAEMLREVLGGIQQAALMAQLAGVGLETEPLVWTDDGERRTTMSFDMPDGTPVFSFETKPADGSQVEPRTADSGNSSSKSTS